MTSSKQVVYLSGHALSPPDWVKEVVSKVSSHPRNQIFMQGSFFKTLETDLVWGLFALGFFFFFGTVPSSESRSPKEDLRKS